MTASEGHNYTGAGWEHDRDYFITARHHTGDAPEKREPITTYGRELRRLVEVIAWLSLAWYVIANLAQWTERLCNFTGACT